MPKAIRLYVRYVDAVNKAVGRFSMYLVFVMGGILLYESISRTLLNQPHIWAVEVAQFVMAAYYLLGGGYSMMIDGHVRMDLLYGRWSKRKQAIVDIITGPVLLFYLGVLFFGAVSATHYAIAFDQKNYTPWGPRLWPIKVIMAFGILLTLLEAISFLFKDIARARGEEIE